MITWREREAYHAAKQCEKDPERLSHMLSNLNKCADSVATSDHVKIGKLEEEWVRDILEEYLNRKQGKTMFPQKALYVT